MDPINRRKNTGKKLPGVLYTVKRARPEVFVCFGKILAGKGFGEFVDNGLVVGGFVGAACQQDHDQYENNTDSSAE